MTGGLVQVLPNDLKQPCVSIKRALKKWGIKTLKPLISQGFQVSVSILVTQHGLWVKSGYRIDETDRKTALLGRAAFAA